jgi:hypothetical protein
MVRGESIRTRHSCAATPPDSDRRHIPFGAMYCEKKPEMAEVAGPAIVAETIPCNKWYVGSNISLVPGGGHLLMRLPGY